jgi:hypothetical protein
MIGKLNHIHINDSPDSIVSNERNQNLITLDLEEIEHNRDAITRYSTPYPQQLQSTENKKRKIPKPLNEIRRSSRSNMFKGEFHYFVISFIKIKINKMKFFPNNLLTFRQS